MSSTNNRRSSSSLVQSSSLAKRQASSSDNLGKSGALPPHMAKKRPALSNITNQRQASHSAAKISNMVPSAAAKIPNAKKGSFPPSSNSAGSSRIRPSSNVKPNEQPNVNLTASVKITSIQEREEKIVTKNDPTAPCDMDISDDFSVSMDETMSTCDSLKSPDVEYIDNNEVAAAEAINISGNICKRDILAQMERTDNVIDLDDNLVDPQLCATMACDIYKHLRASEAKKRPSTDFMERVQKDINASMRAILIDWLVEVAEEYRLVPDTLYLTINYLDRYLSGNTMDRQRLQLLGVACMMIASKYEEICAPQVEEFCYITDNTYFKDEVLQMESAVLNYLKFEMTAPTVKCFLRRFVRAAQGVTEAPSFQLECLASYIAELSLLEYSMLCYAPSLIAASAIFLAKYMLLPTKRPWNSTLQHYTLYQPSDLCECVKALHTLCCNSNDSSLPAIREKYSQHKYKFAAKKYCPPSIPPQFFQNISN